MLPSEHGATVALAEPIVLGLLLAPTGAGALLAASGVTGFWAGQAIRRAQRFGGPGRAIAIGFAIATAALAGAALSAGEQPLAVIVPLAVGAVLGMAFFHLSVKLGARALSVELIGALSPTGLAAAIVVSGGGTWAVAAWAWGLLALRQVGTIPYVRYRLGGKGTQASPAQWPVHAIHVAILLIVLAGWARGDLGITVVAAGVLLATRAVVGMAVPKLLPTAKAVGFSELGVGLAYLLLVWLGLQ